MPPKAKNLKERLLSADDELAADAAAAVSLPIHPTSHPMLVDATAALLPQVDDETASDQPARTAAVSALVTGKPRVRQPKAPGERTNPTCGHLGCTKKAQSRGLCKTHGGGRRCEREGCQKSAQSGTHHCKAHGGGKRCQALDCPKSAAGSTLYCIAHGGGKRCQHTGCTKSAQGNTNLCKAHGGGKRCQQEGCNLPSRGPVNGMWMCAAHGGGPKCQELCGKSAVGITKFCILHGKNRPCKTTGCIGTTLLGGNPFCPLHGGARQCAFPDCKHLVKGQHRAGVEMCATHGGGQRCEHDGCQHAVAPGGTQKYCMAHGGGRRCMQEGCNKAAGEGMMQYCQEHGGGRRCKHPGCMASTAKLKGSAQFCREHAGLQCALDGCTRLAAGGGMTLCKPCMQHLDGKAPSGQGDDFDDDVMAADRMDLSGEPTISLDEVGFLPYRLQVEVAANLDGGEPAPQPPAEVFALGLHGDNGGVGTSHGGGDGMQREAAATSALAADAGMLSATRCDYDGCEAPRLDDGLFCELHTAHCPVVGCGRVAAPGAVQCVLHETRTQGSIKRPRCCEHPDCYKAAARVGANMCINHGGGKRCTYEGCTKSAQGSTTLCKAHGGGKRCEKEGCNKAAASKKGGQPYCKMHGGGTRCEQEGCAKAAVDAFRFCKAHGGGKRCTMEGCNKSAQGGGSAHCIMHGGGRRCTEEGCSKRAMQGAAMRCQEHGGKK